MQPSTVTNPSAAAAPPLDPREQQGREFLVAGRFRKARDIFKDLCKKYRLQYLPLLIEANLGLAREMMGRGMVSEAQQVIAYLKTIAPPAALQALTGEAVSRTGNWQDVLAAVLPALANPAAEVPMSERLRLADQAVLAFQVVPADGSAGPVVAAELHAIHESLQSVCRQHYDQALEAIRSLIHESAAAIKERNWALLDPKNDTMSDLLFYLED